MAKKKRIRKPDVECNFCHLKITNNEKQIQAHNKGDRHVRLRELILKRGVLESWNFDWVEDKNCFLCLSCKQPINKI
jgi:hypothetical protein